MHTVDPAAAQKPALQLEHAVLDPAVAVVEKVPELQAVHADEPAEDHCPRLQLKHTCSGSFEQAAVEEGSGSH